MIEKRIGANTPCCNRGIHIGLFVNCPHCGKPLPKALTLKSEVKPLETKRKAVKKKVTRRRRRKK